MAMDATFQIRMNSELKSEVESLYRSLGTSFAEAVRIFAQQSLREGGMPFTPSLKTWDELSQDEINAKLRKSAADIASGRTLSQDALDAKSRDYKRTWTNTISYTQMLPPTISLKSFNTSPASFTTVPLPNAGTLA